MDKDFICPRLLKWAKLFYGEDAKCFSFEKDGKYIFGSTGNKSVLTKAVAIFLVIGELPDIKPTKAPTTKIKRRRTR